MVGRARSVVALAVAVTVVGSSGPALAAAASASASSSAPGADLTDDHARFPLTDAEVREALGTAQDDVTFSVRDRRTGATYTYNPDLRTSTASIVKVLVLATVIRERRESGRDLSERQQELAELMIRFSDNDATTSLFEQVGRDGVARMARDLGMTRTEIDWSWGMSSTSAADQRLLMDRLVDGTPHLSESDRRYILDLMGDVDSEQAWGVGDVPATAKASVKNGWLPLETRGWHVNSIGSVEAPGREYTLAVLTYDNDTMESGVERTEAVSTLVWDALGTGAAAQGGPGAAAPDLPRWITRGDAYPPRPWG